MERSKVVCLAKSTRMADRILWTIFSLVTLTCSVHSQSTVGSVSGTTCPNGQPVSMGLFTTGSTILPSTTTPSAGSAYSFTGGITLPNTVNTQEACNTFCQSLSTCTAIMFQGTCVNGVETGICTFINTTVPITSGGTTASGACATRVYTKYCPSTGGTNTGTSTGTSTGSTLAENQWSPWKPEGACITTSGTRSRRRVCQGSACGCPSASSTSATVSCTAIDGGMEAVETTSCSVPCQDSIQDYIDYCAFVNENDITVPDQCNNTRHQFCMKTNTNSWTVVPRPCAPGTRYEPDTNNCLALQFGEIGYVAPAANPVVACTKFKVGEDIMKYRENGAELTCNSGYIYDRKMCKCYPGPGTAIPRSDIVTVLCFGDNAYNAGGDLVSANAYPSDRAIQYTTFIENTVCRFPGQSNTMAGGLQIHDLSGKGMVVHPSFSFWFMDTGTGTGKRVLLTNRKFTGSTLFFGSSPEPNIEVYLQGTGLFVTSSNLATGSQITVNSNIQKNIWYYVHVVFDHGPDAKAWSTPSSLEILCYLRQEGQALGNPVSGTVTSNTVIMQTTPMKVAYSGDENDPQFFTGLIDSITATQSTRISQAMVQQMSDISPTSYTTTTP